MHVSQLASASNGGVSGVDPTATLAAGFRGVRYLITADLWTLSVLAKESAVFDPTRTSTALTNGYQVVKSFRYLLTDLRQFDILHPALAEPISCPLTRACTH